MANDIVNVSNVNGYVDERGTVWLNAEDVARGLGFVQIKNGVEYVRWERVNGYLKEYGFPTCGEYLPENMFYRLAMKASNAAAQKFQAKVADEILPAIRQHGLYINPNAPINPNFLRRMADELEQRDKQIAALSAEVNLLRPKADYCERILQSDEALPVTVIAKDYGMSAIKFNELLRKLNVQYKVGKTWVLRQLYANMGYVKTVVYEIGEHITRTLTYWTQKGRMFLYNLLKKTGVVPLLERNESVSTLF